MKYKQVIVYSFCLLFCLYQCFKILYSQIHRETKKKKKRINGPQPSY